MEKIKDKSNSMTTCLRQATENDNLGKFWSAYSLFKYHLCGHERFLQRSSVSLTGPKCFICKANEIKAKYNAEGLEFVGKAENKNQYYFKYKDCGHIQKMFLQNTKSGSHKCNQCQSELYRKEAEKANLTLIEDGVNYGNGSRLYRFNSCGHTKKLQIGKVRESAFKCRICEKLKFEVEADSLDLKLLENLNTKRGDRKYRLPCGHTKNMQLGAVRLKSFRCRECNSGALDRKSFLYIYKFNHNDFEWLKLGFAGDLDLRLSQYKVDKTCTHELVFSQSFNTGFEAAAFETDIHNSFKDKRIDPTLMKQYMRVSGFTECYPLHMLENLIKEITNRIKELNE